MYSYRTRLKKNKLKRCNRKLARAVPRGQFTLWSASVVIGKLVAKLSAVAFLTHSVPDVGLGVGSGVIGAGVGLLVGGNGILWSKHFSSLKFCSIKGLNVSRKKVLEKHRNTQILPPMEIAN